MLKRLGKTITNNFSLKILAVILAVVLWVVVINIDDPTTSKTYTTNVVAENTDYITSQNKYYEPLDSSNVVSFRVSATRAACTMNYPMPIFPQRRTWRILSTMREAEFTACR